jgi:hypothetical protein
MGGVALQVLALGEMWSVSTPNELEARTAVGVTLWCLFSDILITVIPNGAGHSGRAV